MTTWMEGVRASASARVLCPLYESALLFQRAEDDRDSEDKSNAEVGGKLLLVGWSMREEDKWEVRWGIKLIFKLRRQMLITGGLYTE